ncbi:MAG: hypothetical protein AB1416_11675 [Actinomycetota bacterium]
MTPSGSWTALWRYVAAAAACAALGLLSFQGDGAVPLLRYVDLGIHESGHLATYWLPDLWTAMAGSVAQVAVPLLISAYFAAVRREVVGAALCLAWAGTSANNASVYIADAPVEALPLVGGGTHDWAYALGPEGFDAIDSAGRIAGAVHGAGLAMVVVAAAVSLAAPALAARRDAARIGGEPARR